MTARATAAVLLAAAAAASGCAAKYLYGPLGDATAQPRDDDCEFAVTDVIPDRPFDTLGVLAPDDIEASRVHTDVTKMQKAIAEEVCASGGDAVVVERDPAGRFVRGTIIKLK